ncbi:hypothetical protein WMY93_031519 [Mugilogobius chulae]|uniref:Uncharacterized protein n=1 Tax=Mugilogobius chulae TaxID=88201 RepID=A0AAW0MM41_9GOBI
MLINIEYRNIKLKKHSSKQNVEGADCSGPARSNCRPPGPDRSREALQSFAFLVFVLVCLVGSVFLFFVLPETKNQTFQDISLSFARINGVTLPPPAQEMELVLSVSPQSNGKQEPRKETQDGTESSF